MGISRKSEKDLRRHPRVDIQIHADYRVIPPQRVSSRIRVETKNISIGGLMFYSKVPIKAGSHLDIRLFLEKETLEFTAKVVWTADWPDSEASETSYSVGLQYLKISSESLSKINDAASRIVRLEPAS